MLSEKPWKLDTAIRLLLSIGICVCSVFFLLGSSFYLSGRQKPDDSSPLYLVIVTLGLHGSILAMIAFFIYRERLNWAQAFGFRTAGLPWALVLATLAVVIFLPIGSLLQAVSVKLLGLIHVSAPEQQAVQTIRKTTPGFGRIYLIVFSVFVAPVAEETLFRGILYPAIKQSGFPRAAFWVTSLAFASIHLSLSIFLPLTALAMVLIFLYERTDNLLAPIFAHALFNAANLVVLYSGDSLNHWTGS